MKLTLSQKKEIAKMAVEKSTCIENGTLHVWFNGFEFSILVNSEYRDNEHVRVCTLEVWNESKPYSQAAFLRQIDSL